MLPNSALCNFLETQAWGRISVILSSPPKNGFMLLCDTEITNDMSFFCHTPPSMGGELDETTR